MKSKNSKNIDKCFDPKVSIVIPVYNGSNYVKEAIDSALSQTYTNIEIIVINDGSTDGGATDKICRSYGTKIRYFVKENGGVASALNMGIEKMEGEYFSWLSHDDVYYPNKVESEINVLSKLEDKDTIIYSDYVVTDEELREIYREELSKLFPIKQLNKPLFSLLHGYIDGLTLLISKNCFKEYGVFDETLATTQDYDLWFRIFRSCAIKYIPEILVQTRQHKNQASLTMKNTHLKEKNNLWLGMFSKLTLKEKLFLNESELSFYQEYYNHFKKFGINKRACAYIRGKLLIEYGKLAYVNIDKTLIDNLSIQLEIESKSGLKRFLSQFVPFSNNKSTIVFWSDNWKYRGGLNKMIVAIAAQLTRNFNVIICCWKDKDTKQGFEIPKGVKFLAIDKNLIASDKVPLLMCFMGVKLFICSHNFFIDYLKLYKQFFYLGIKTIAWDHTHYFIPYSYHWLYNVARYKNVAYKYTSSIVCVNNLATGIYKKLGYDAVTMKNPVLIKSPKTSKRPGANDYKNIIAVARFDEYQKRLDSLLFVFSKVLKVLPKTKLYVVGSYDLSAPIKHGAKETFLELLNRLKIKNNVIFTGEINNVEDYYKKASVNILPSELEGFGVVITEAAVFGVPSVVFDGNGSDDVITDGIDGYIIPSRDYDLMARKVVNLLSDEKLLLKMKESLKKMVQRYNIKTIGKEWEALCNEIIQVDNNYSKQNNLNKYSNESESNLVKMYENAIHGMLVYYRTKELKDEYVFNKKIADMQKTISWRITLPLRKARRLIELIKDQGIKVTFKNIMIKIKEKLKSNIV